MRSDYVSRNAVSADRTLHVFNMTNKALRLPVFVLSICSTGIAGIHVAKSLTAGEPLDGTALNILQYGTGMFLLASSMYIKRSDPTLLDKEPFWKAAHRYVADKVGRIKMAVPNPLPEPAPSLASVPARTSAGTLDGYVTA